MHQPVFDPSDYWSELARLKPVDSGWKNKQMQQMIQPVFIPPHVIATFFITALLLIFCKKKDFPLTLLCMGVYSNVCAWGG